MPTIDDWLRGRAMGPSADWLRKIAESSGYTVEQITAFLCRRGNPMTDPYKHSDLLARAVGIAAHTHHGALDRGGAPTILHPLRLLRRATTPEEQLVALLHDTIEDGSWEIDDLEREGFPAPVLAALDCLTKGADEEYLAYIERVAANPLAVRIKLWDLDDNLNVARLARITERDMDRLERYFSARRRLLEAL